MTLRPKRITVGDVFLLELKGGVAFIQFAWDHKLNGQGIWVCKRVVSSDTHCVDMALEEKFFAFYLLREALKYDLVKWAGRQPVAELPKMFKAPGTIRDGMALN